MTEIPSTDSSAAIDARASRWRWVSAIWCSFALFDASQTVVVMRAMGMHHHWGSLFVYRFLAWLVWACATPLIWQLRQRYPLQHWRQPQVWLAHLSACGLIAVLTVTLITVMDLLMDPWARMQPPAPFVEMWTQEFFGNLLSDLVLYGTLLLIASGLDYRERLALQRAETARLNQQLVQAQLDALRRQIEPHFLFNTLNAVAGLVREQRNTAAVAMLAGVSDLLRRVLDTSNRPLVALGEEIEFLRKYFDIQQMRFGDRLQIEIDVPEDLLPVRVPGLILQPIVENAFRHGIAQRVQAGAIRVTVARAGSRLLLSVDNDGPGLPADPARLRAGIGLGNIRERLQGLYGDKAALDIANRPGGVIVRISLPYAGE